MNIDRPVCVFDLETTGINITRDRIVEISILRIEPDGTETVKTWRVNPGIPIPPQASEVHGIYDEDVADKPPFKEIAAEIHELIKDAYLVGFNSNRFDLPMLAEELIRAGINIDLKTNRSIDVQVIYHKKEPRNLSAAYRFYTGKDLENAHSAEADVKATWEVLKAQLEKYEDLPKNLQELSAFSSHHNSADFQGRIIYDQDGDEVINFGKYKGQKLEKILEKDPGYYGWVLNSDFTEFTKQIFRNVHERIKLKKQQAKLNALKDKFNPGKH